MNAPRQPVEMITLPWDEGVRLIAREAAREAAKAVIEDHVKTCPARLAPDKPDPAGRLRIRKEFLVGVIVGSAAVGGFVGGFLQKIIPW